MTAAVLDINLGRGPLTVRPISPTIGAEVEGVDLAAQLHDEVRAALRALLLQHKVLFFRDQPLTSEQHQAFAGQFGEIYAHPGGGVEGHRP